MRSHRLYLLTVLGIVLLCIAGCAQETPTSQVPPTPTAPQASETQADSPLPTATTADTPSDLTTSPLPAGAPTLIPSNLTAKPDSGIVQGLLSLNDQPALDNVLYLALIIETGDAMDVAALDAVNDPRAATDMTGRFVFFDVAPGRYALGIASPVGPVLIQLAGEEIVAEVVAGQVIDLGEIPIVPFNE